MPEHSLDASVAGNREISARNMPWRRSAAPASLGRSATEDIGERCPPDDARVVRERPDCPGAPGTL